MLEQKRVRYLCWPKKKVGCVMQSSATGDQGGKVSSSKGKRLLVGSSSGLMAKLGVASWNLLKVCFRGLL